MEDTPIIHNFSHEAFGSRFWVRIAAEDGVYARNAAEALFQLLDDLDFLTNQDRILTVATSHLILNIQASQDPL